MFSILRFAYYSSDDKGMETDQTSNMPITYNQKRAASRVIGGCNTTRKRKEIDPHQPHAGDAIRIRVHNLLSFELARGVPLTHSGIACPCLHTTQYSGWPCYLTIRRVETFLAGPSSEPKKGAPSSLQREETPRLSGIVKGSDLDGMVIVAIGGHHKRSEPIKEFERTNREGTDRRGEGGGREGGGGGEGRRRAISLRLAQRT